MFSFARPSLYKERVYQTMATLTIENNDIAWPALRLVRGAISVKRHVPQYVDDSVSNVSHLPAVNYRI